MRLKAGSSTPVTRTMYMFGIFHLFNLNRIDCSEVLIALRVPRRLSTLVQDLGTFMMIEHMKRVHSANTSDVRFIFDKAAGGPRQVSLRSI